MRCTKGFGEKCAAHPIDCPNCKNEKICQQKDIMQKYREKIGHCKCFERK